MHLVLLRTDFKQNIEHSKTSSQEAASGQVSHRVNKHLIIWCMEQRKSVNDWTHWTSSTLLLYKNKKFEN